MTGAGSRIAAFALAALVAAPALAQPMPPAPPERREIVAGWRIQHLNDDESGRDVRMMLARNGFAITYYANYWHGNSSPYYGLSIDRRGQGCAGGEWRDEPPRGFPPARPGEGARLRARLVRDLAECGLGARQADALLQGFTPAYARFAVLADQARRYVIGVGCSIEHNPEGPAVVRRLCHRR